MKDFRYERSGRNKQADGEKRWSSPKERQVHEHYSHNDENEYNFWHGDVSPDATTINFNMDLQNLAEEDAQKAQDALEIMQDLYQQHGNESIYIQPNAACYTTVIDGWLQSDTDDAAIRAQSLLDRMEQLYDETGDERVRPNAVTYMLVCQAWADTYSDDFSCTTAERAEKILERMKERGIRPSVKIYTSVLLSWCKRAGKVRGAMERAEKLLAEMESYAMKEEEESEEESDEKESGEDSAEEGSRSRKPQEEVIRPNVITYTAFIGGLARSKEHNLATRAEAVLERMEQHGIQPDMVAYTSVLNALSKSKSRKEKERAASKAIAIIKQMEELYDEEAYYAKPTLITYSTAINAIGNSLDPSAPELAESMLRHLYDLHESKQPGGMKPTTATFNAVITAMARSKLRRGRKTAQRAEQLLVEMFRRTEQGETNVEPNVKSWGGVMLAWAESGLPDAPENAQRVLDKMEELYRKGNSMVEPNVVCFTTVMSAWCRAGQVDRAERILKKMEEQYEVTGDKEVRPNSISYVTMIDGFVRQNVPNAAERAQETVDRMMKLYSKDVGFIKPSKIVFNTLINAYSRSFEPEAAQKAERILQWMESRYRESGDTYYKPDEITFCGVLNAWANHAYNGGAERAQQMLEHMESLTDEERGFRQTVICYNIVIKALARSGGMKSIQYAERIVERLERHSDVQPDTTTYSSLINCCAYYHGPPEGRTEALAVALRTFKKLCKADGERPNSVTYGTLFKAVDNLAKIGSDRDDLIRKLFRQCCEGGQVDGFVLSQVRNACSASLFRELVSEPIGVHGAKGEANIKTLLRKMPPRWARNRLI